MTIRLSLLGAVLLLAALAACQGGGPPALTLDEAKKATAEFSGSFTPPPRTIKNIMARIDESRSSGEHCGLVPPQTDEEIRKIMMAFPAPRSGDWRRVKYVASQASEQFYNGNYRRGIKLMKWAVDEAPVGASFTATFLGELASYQAHGGEFEEAEHTLGQAISLQSGIKNWGGYKKSGLDWLNFHVSESRGTLAAAKGQLALAEAYYRKAIDIAGKGDGVMVRDLRHEFAKLSLARTLASQGRLLEAENILRELLKDTLPNVTPVVAIAMLRYSEVLYEQGRYTEAETVARTTVKMFRGLCTAPENIQLAEARNSLAKTLVAQERWGHALEQYDTIRAAMAKDMDSYDRLFSGTLYKGLALLRTGRTDEAARDLAKALQRTEERLGSKHYRAAEIRGFLAMARLQEGASAEALDAFAAATKILLTRSRESDDESNTFKARDQRLNLILESYMGLLADIRGTDLEKKAGIDAMSKSFKLADTARSRAIQRALAASGSRAALKDPALADLARREQDTQKQITALYGTLAAEFTRPPQERNLARLQGLKTTIDQLRGARAVLMEEIERRFPDYAELINPKPLTIEDARSVLRPGEALISTYVGRERTFVWAVPHRGEVVFKAVGMGQEDLSDTVALLRGALEPNARTLGDIPEFDVAAAYKLYERLLAPVKAGWGDANSLLIVAHGPLGYLPMSILPTENVALGPEREPLFANYRDVPWLARTHAITMLPSVASLKTLRSLPPGDDKRLPFAGFGDPWFSTEQAASAALPKAKPQRVAALASRGIRTRGLRLRAAPKTTEMDSAELARLPRLPDTAEEVKSIAIALNANLTESVFLGREANEGRIKSMDLSGYKVLAFATHGLVPGDLDGLVQPALAFTSPEVSGGSEDGLLTMGEILGLKLNADWVVLSACNTGSGQGAGAEAVSGLGQAFFYAGTRALLVSNWPVETTSAKALTTDLFKRQADDPTLTRAEALRQAMLGLIDGPGFVDEGKAVFSYAHPLFWAPFTLIGDGGGGG
ncbi:MAG: CHAT domain-containing protein [Proteobacteria bacterium]|nr:CHAT domain-containing protein [Pseudomonadota bacterium]